MLVTFLVLRVLLCEYKDFVPTNGSSSHTVFPWCGNPDDLEQAACREAMTQGRSTLGSGQPVFSPLRN